MSVMVIRTPPHKGILWINTNSGNNHHQGSNQVPLWQLSTCDCVPVAIKLMLGLFTPPARGEEAERDGAADDLLHVGADDRQLHHQPQDDARHLSGSGDVYETHRTSEENFLLQISTLYCSYYC